MSRDRFELLRNSITDIAKVSSRRLQTSVERSDHSQGPCNVEITTTETNNYDIIDPAAHMFSREIQSREASRSASRISREASKERTPTRTAIQTYSKSSTRKQKVRHVVQDQQPFTFSNGNAQHITVGDVMDQ